MTNTDVADIVCAKVSDDGETATISTVCEGCDGDGITADGRMCGECVGHGVYESHMSSHELWRACRRYMRGPGVRWVQQDVRDLGEGPCPCASCAHDHHSEPLHAWSLFDDD